MPFTHEERLSLQRIKKYIHATDEFLSITDKVESRDWDTVNNGNLVALLFHFLYLIAQANLKNPQYPGNDSSNHDNLRTKWSSHVASLTVITLWIFSIANAVYSFSRTRHYRLFESSIFNPPSTTSVRRVRIDSSPVSSLYLRICNTFWGDSAAESRAYPDSTRDVWQIDIWDPISLCLRIFCFFSPGHIFIYWLFFPVSALDTWPSVTVVKVVLLQILMSLQLSLLEVNFCQKSKDSTIIYGNLMNEYDTKFVHPRLNPIVRDTGTQYINSDSDTKNEDDELVDTYQPKINLKKSFKTYPNPHLIRISNSKNNNSLLYRDDSSKASLSPYEYDTRRTSDSIFITKTSLGNNKTRQNMDYEVFAEKPSKNFLNTSEMQSSQSDKSLSFDVAYQDEKDHKYQEFKPNRTSEDENRHDHFPRPPNRSKRTFPPRNFERVPSMFR